MSRRFPDRAEGRTFDHVWQPGPIPILNPRDPVLVWPDPGTLAITATWVELQEGGRILAATLSGQPIHAVWLQGRAGAEATVEKAEAYFEAKLIEQLRREARAA